MAVSGVPANFELARKALQKTGGLHLFMAVLAVIAIIWGALMAIAQRDMKLLVAYSSVSHMGFVVLGIFSYNVQGQQGAVLQMVNHGIIISALFLIVAWISDRAGTRDRSAMAGLAPASNWRRC